MGTIFFGTAGWSYPDWKGTFYPASTAGLDELAYIADYFDAVEVNNTFYRPPEAAHAEGWVRRTEGRREFRFAVKLHRRFTHERHTPWSEDEADRFRRGIEPLVEAGRLGALLLQFPWSFRNTEGNRRWLADLSRAFHGLPLVAELRHAGWDRPAALGFLRGLEVGFCNLDQPASRDAVGPTAAATSPVGYVRFHGRNRENWFRKDAGRDARYDYLYSDAELEEWVPRILAVAQETQTAFVIGNNHFKAQAPANILQIRRKIAGGPLRAPEPLLDAFPFLRALR